MPPSPTRTSVLALAAALLALPPLPSLGRAWDAPAGPVPLYPPDSSDQAEPTMPGPDRAPAAQPLPERLKTPGEAAVEIAPLEALDPAAIGLLGPESGGFARGLWSGASRAQIAALLPHLPAATPSPAMNALADRLLLSAAAVPEEAGAAEWGWAGTEAAPSLLALRLERLVAGGRVDAAAVLIARAESLLRDEDAAVHRLRSEIQLLAGEEEAACATAERFVVASQEPYWLKLAAFCRLRQGKADEAQILLDLLQEQSESDPVFFALYAAIAKGKAGAVPEMERVTPLRLAMLRAAGLPPPEAALAQSGPAVLSRIARLKDIDPALRVTAAERAAALGALPPERLAEVYASVPFAPDEIAAARARAAAAPGPRSNALLYQAIMRAGSGAQAGLLKAALEAAQRAGNFPMAARLYHSSLRALAPDPAYLSLAPEAVRALLAASEREAAQRWYEMAAGQAGRSGAIGERALRRMALLLTLTGPAPGPEKEIGEDWAGRSFELGDPAERARAVRVLAALTMLGHAVAPAAWTPLLAPGARNETAPDASLLLQLAAAARESQTGASVLLALDAIGAQGPGAVHPAVLAAALDGLVRVGLGEDARALARDAALLAGV